MKEVPQNLLKKFEHNETVKSLRNKVDQPEYYRTPGKRKNKDSPGPRGRSHSKSGGRVKFKTPRRDEDEDDDPASAYKNAGTPGTQNREIKKAIQQLISLVSDKQNLISLFMTRDIGRQLDQARDLVEAAQSRGSNVGSCNNLLIDLQNDERSFRKQLENNEEGSPNLIDVMKHLQDLIENERDDANEAHRRTLTRAVANEREAGEFETSQLNKQVKDLEYQVQMLKEQLGAGDLSDDELIQRNSQLSSQVERLNISNDDLRRRLER